MVSPLWVIVSNSGACCPTRKVMADRPYDGLARMSRCRGAGTISAYPADVRRLSATFSAWNPWFMARAEKISHKLRTESSKYALDLGTARLAGLSLAARPADAAARRGPPRAGRSARSFRSPWLLAARAGVARHPRARRDPDQRDRGRDPRGRAGAIVDRPATRRRHRRPDARRSSRRRHRRGDPRRDP